jgi:uncharacterized protein
MSRPRRIRKISDEPKIRCFKPDSADLDSNNPIEITIDEYESIRLRDYHDIQQKKSAEMMGISQPTFHRTISSARKKIAKALIEGEMIIITGDDFITEKIKYKCNICGFEWSSPEKEYDKCLDCQSEDIKMTKEEITSPQEIDSIVQRRSYGGRGLGAGPPKVCKCPECGYESPKTRAVPCRNTKCPECETPLCGSDQTDR